ncbi:hypothetical protein B0F90DRAFT_1821114 [Multifurca ochricompacta]|uniref:DUF4219 domain-containing protein n=1 Tax=Multifurca ochricompacta TaxID=376703 RepID=A0AAD4M035_9AGAM|nr:hypothetical protein B0F90DRAFT_1821114 [Multifurca ochricompacta]
MSNPNLHCLESWQLDPISLHPKLDYNNYSHWSFKTELILQSRGLWDLVDGTELAPTEESERRRWKMRDAYKPQSLALRKFTSTKLHEDGDVPAHIQHMGEFWQDVLASKAYTSRNPDVFFVTTLLDSLPPSWSVFVGAWKIAPDQSKVSRSSVIGHILDLDAWNRGRSEAHNGRAAGHRRPRANKPVED